MARQASLVLRLLNLPSFLLAVFIMYWSVPLCILQNRIRPWKLRGPRNDAYGWCVRFHVRQCRCFHCPSAFLGRIRAFALMHAGVLGCSACSAYACGKCRDRRCTKEAPASGWYAGAHECVSQHIPDVAHLTVCPSSRSAITGRGQTSSLTWSRRKATPRCSAGRGPASLLSRTSGSAC